MRLLGTSPAGGAGGVTTFLGLTDTPAVYGGFTNRVLRVNGSATALEFYTRLGLTDPSPHVTVTGDARITNNLGVRTAPATDDSNFIKCNPTLSVAGNVEAVQITPTIDINAGANRALYALRGTMIGKVSGGGSFNAIIGLDYVVAPWSDGAGTHAVSLMTGLQSALQSIRSNGILNITTAAAITAGAFQSVIATATTITDLIGVDILGPFTSVGGGITTATGIRIGHIGFGTNRYLIHALRNATSPSLRLDAGNPPNAASVTEGDSQIYLAWMENGTVNFRQVRWRQQSSLNATDKVLIAA